jgi:hypothetical protein
LVISDDELVAFVEWRREYAALLHNQSADLAAATRDDPSRPLDDVAKEAGIRVTEMATRYGALLKEHFDRCPLKGERMDLATEATGGLFHIEFSPGSASLVIARDEERIGAARRRFGAKAVDDILARNSLILSPLTGPATSTIGAPVADSRSPSVPSAMELDAYVTGAGRVHLGMTESEVSDALGKKPARRDDAMSPGASTDVAWDGLEGARPGAALGRFLDGRLVRIEFAPASSVFPRIDRAVAAAVTSADFVRASVARTLQMADIEAVTRTPAHRRAWIIGRGNDGKTTVGSRWIWEVEPGGKALLVEEADGLAGQPHIRSLK